MSKRKILSIALSFIFCFFLSMPVNAYSGVVEAELDYGQQSSFAELDASQCRYGGYWVLSIDISNNKESLDNMMYYLYGPDNQQIFKGTLQPGLTTTENIWLDNPKSGIYRLVLKSVKRHDENGFMTRGYGQLMLFKFWSDPR